MILCLSREKLKFKIVCPGLIMCCNEHFMASQCAGPSVGAANQLFSSLIQTILAFQCSLSPPDMWPKDYGETVLNEGKFYFNLKID